MFLFQQRPDPKHHLFINRPSVLGSVAIMFITLGMILFASAGVSQGSDRYNTQETAIEVQEIADGLSNPWGMAELPNGQILVTERSGSMVLVNPQSGNKRKVDGLPKIAVGGQGGLLDVALDPAFENNRRLYLSFSQAAESGSGAGTAIASAVLSTGASPRLENVQILYSLPNKTTRGQHFGSRIVLPGDGTLFFTIGDRGNDDRAQDTADGAGSVLRINTDGSIPADNPFAGDASKDQAIWSYGHRNPQGAALNTSTGELWTVEHGARGGDEINIPEKGKNYGWPVISYGRHYSGFKIGEGTQKQGMEQPIHFWDPSIAPSGMAYYDADLFPEWRGNIFVGALKDQMLVRLSLDGNRIIGEERLLAGQYGRIRDVRVFSDGAIWLLTDDSDGQLLRISPAG